MVALNLERIAGSLKDISPPLQIAFHSSRQKTEFSIRLFNLAGELVKAAEGGIELAQDKGEHLPAAPALSFYHPGRGAIHYLALPEGQEQMPFVEMLNCQESGAHGLHKNLKKNLSDLMQPADLQIFITSNCPNCPHAVRAANTLALLSEKITTTIIDVEQFPELAEQFKIRSVPMIVLDGGFLINRVVLILELARKILARGSEEYEEGLFQSLVTTGNISRAANRILQDRESARYFVSAWQKSSLSERMSLMLIAEEALAQKSKILDSIVPELIALLKTQDTSLRGDTVDLLGQIGHSDARQPLAALLQDSNPDIVEIAKEALAELDNFGK